MLYYPGKPNVITRVLIRWKRGTEDQSQRRRGDDIKVEVRVMCGHGPRQVGGL